MLWCRLDVTAGSRNERWTRSGRLWNAVAGTIDGAEPTDDRGNGAAVMTADRRNGYAPKRIAVTVVRWNGVE